MSQSLIPIGGIINLTSKLNNNSVLLMGVLNVTPDSFYDGGKYNSVERAVKRAKEMEKEGADIIDIGGESTRPGATPISAEKELNRVLPVLKSLDIDIPISVDTYKSEVAEKALTNGADIVNDVYGLRYDEDIARIIADHDASVIIMHIQGEPQTMQKNPTYEDPVKEIKKFLKKRINYATSKGINQDKIIIDPGIGFGKSTEHNLEILRNLDKFKSLNQPIMIGVSRKSLINDISNEDLNPENRLIGSIAAEIISIIKGAQIIRAHDIKETRKAINTSKIILEK